MNKITIQLVNRFENHLIGEEKSRATIEKYIRDITAFKVWIEDRIVNKEEVIKYKNTIIERYAPASANSMLSSINSFFNFMGWYHCRVKAFKIQKQIFADEEKELTKNEYKKLLNYIHN